MSPSAVGLVEEHVHPREIDADRDRAVAPGPHDLVGGGDQVFERQGFEGGAAGHRGVTPFRVNMLHLRTRAGSAIGLSLGTGTGSGLGAGPAASRAKIGSPPTGGLCGFTGTAAAAARAGP